MDNPVISLRVAVRNLVEFVLQTGDLVSVFTGSGRALAGIRGHQKIQKSRPANYQAEVSLSYLVETYEFSLEIFGRIDGVWLQDEVILEEIKTTTSNLAHISEENHPLHWAQAKVYGYIYAKQNSLPSLTIKMTYFHLESERIREIDQLYTFEELELFFNDLITKYLEWSKVLYDWYELRNLSIRELPFPHANYRLGQRELAVKTYSAIRQQYKLYIQAPTGTGKTVGVLFPALKALEKLEFDKIFYLTAKTTTRAIAENTTNLLRKQELRLKSLTLTAKEKICFCPGKNCHPDECQYAVAFYDKIKIALHQAFSADEWNREYLESVSREFEVCPFEFSLFMSLWADLIICDYNYVFDPSAFLKRFFEVVAEDFIFLVDEAHNLPDRARDSFSAQLDTATLKSIKKQIRQLSPKLSRNYNKIINYFTTTDKENPIEFQTNEEAPKKLIQLIRDFLKVAEEFLVQNPVFPFRDELIEVYFEFVLFVKISDLYDEHYLTYLEKINKVIRIKLFCLDPSKLLCEAMHKAKSTILFSGTLLPFDYFFNILGGEENDTKLILPSPFPRENYSLVVTDYINTEYKYREDSYAPIADTINMIVSHKKGNYLVYFPSFDYLNKVLAKYTESFGNEGLLNQNNSMTEEERAEFLEHFTEAKPDGVLGFAVLGGIFGEGIDLTGDRLIGTIIVSVGLPQINREKDLIKDYFNKAMNEGFEYAYTYPGLNRVIQAAGRVIRTETDRGVIFLIDKRYDQYRYKKLLPKEWKNYILSKNEQQTKECLDYFWSLTNL